MFIAAIGFSAAFTGFFLGGLLSLITGKRHERIQAVFMGFAAGALLAFVCFQMLPQIIVRHGVFIGLAGVILGAVIAAGLDSASVFAAGIALHGIPEGVALGSMLHYDFSVGMYMAVVLALHFIPESLVLFGYFKKEGLTPIAILPITLALALPVGLGAVLGGTLVGMPDTFSSICLALTVGIMLYLVCGKILPDTIKHRITTMAAAVGFAAGVWVSR